MQDSRGVDDAARMIRGRRRQQARGHDHSAFMARIKTARHGRFRIHRAKPRTAGSRPGQDASPRFGDFGPMLTARPGRQGLQASMVRLQVAAVDAASRRWQA